MSIEVFIAVLAAALMHAAWNAVIKQRLDRFLSISLMSFFMGGLSVLGIPFLPVPEGTTWLWILLSAALHTGYKIYLIRAYDSGDLAQVYPLARGAAPLLTAIAGVVLLSEVLSWTMGAGIAVLCLGIALMSFRGGAALERLSGVAVANALITSVFIAAYTIVDGVGVRSAVTASSYALWMFAIDGLFMAIFCLAMRGRGVFRELLPEWRGGLFTGAMSLGAYWIVIWAMSKAPIAAVAALRETSILFAMLIAMFVLKEKMTLWRGMSAVLIVAGVVGLRVG